MKQSWLAWFLVLLIVACSVPSIPAPITPMPSPAPSVIIAAAATPTTAPTIPPTAVPRPFIVQQQFALRELSGIGRHPIAIAVSGDRVYTLNSVSQNIAVIQNNRVAKFIPLFGRPTAFAVDAEQNRLYIADDTKMLNAFANEQSIATQHFEENVRAILPFDNHLFVGFDSKTGVVVLDPTTLKEQARITIPNSFTVISLSGDAAHHRLYINAYEKTAVVDSTTMRVLLVMDAKGSYETMVANPVSNNVLISIYDSQTSSAYLTLFDPQTGKPGARVKLGGDPRQAILNRDGTRAYVANSFTNDLSVIDPRAMSVVATIPVGLQPWSLALDENTKRLYVANYDSDSVTIINTDNNQIVVTIPLGMIPTALAVNESAGRVYIANASTDSVFVVEGARIVKEIGVGHHPIALARDEKNNRVLVANQADHTLSIIDESTFAVRATQPITRYVSTVEVDSARSRIFVNDVILNTNTLAQTGSQTMRGFSMGSLVTPTFVRVNPNTGRIYAIASNGVYGSGGRSVVYSIDGTSLEQRATLGLNASAAFLDIDPQTNRVFVVGTHPLDYSNQLGAFDLNDTKVYSLPLPARTTGMILNPQTRHLFLAHANSYTQFPNQTFADNTIQVLDADSFGEVARITLNAPGKMARLGNIIYVANEQGAITLIPDANAPTPPSPTPTVTITPYPSSTPTAIATRRPATPIATSVSLNCAIRTAPFAQATWASLSTRLGCATESERQVAFVVQRFDRGAMFWREDEKRIYILSNSDNTWSTFLDTWVGGQNEDSCPSINAAPGKIKPRRGFGKLWCEQNSIRTKIGDAIADELALPARSTQRFERGVMFTGDAPGNVIALFNDAKWQ
jgi:YVTN family beta-propeller protein